MDDDDDIFHMLLNENETKRGKNIRPSKTSKPSNSNAAMDSEGVGSDCDLNFGLKLSIDSTFSHTSKRTETDILEYIHKQPWLVLDHCSDEDSLYVLLEKNDTAVVQMYHLDCTKAQTLSIGGIFETSLSSSLFKSTDRERANCRRIYLVKQHTSPSTDIPIQTDQSFDLGNVNLPLPTYASLFGKTTSLMNSPALLLCANNGCVYWRPVKRVGQEEHFFLMCQLHDVVNCVLVVAVKKKLVADKKVAEILQSALSMGDSEPGNENVIGLLFSSHIGECCLMLPSQSKKSELEQFPVRFYLPHSVVHCMHIEQQLIYTTGWSVESVTLCLTQEGNRPIVTLENCVTLMMAEIEKLLFKTAPSIGPGSQLMGLTSELDIVHIPTKSPSSTGHSNSETHLIDTIQCIQQHNSSVRDLKEKSSALDSHLAELNLFSNLFHQHQTKKAKSHDKPKPLIHCDCLLDQSVGNIENSVIKILVRNDSKIDLSNCWSILVTRVPECPVTEARVVTDSFVFKLDKGFHSGHEKTYSVPLPETVQAQWDPMSRLHVHVSLVLCCSQEVAFQASPSNKQFSMLEVEIHTQVLDCLHFLYISTSATISSSVGSGYSIEYLAAVLEKRWSKKYKDQSQSLESPPRKKFVSKMICPDFTDQEFKCEVKEEALKRLLYNMRHFSDANNIFVCQTPSGTDISFKLEKREATPVHGQMSLQLRLESFDADLLHVTFISIMERFKDIHQ